MKEPLNYHSSNVVSKGTRLLAVVTGCVAGATGSVGFGWSFLIVAAVLVCGAIVQPSSPRPGRWLMWVGAALLSGGIFPIGIGLALTGLPSLRDAGVIGMVSLFIASILLVSWCDAALVIDALKFAGDRNSRERPSSGTQDWIILVAAVLLSYWLLPGSFRGLFSYRQNGRLDVLCLCLGMSSFVILFDVAVVTHMLKIRRAQRT